MFGHQKASTMTTGKRLFFLCLCVVLLEYAKGKKYGDISVEPVYGYEIDGSVTITVSRATASPDPLNFRYKTKDGSAKAGSDYTAVTSTAASIPANSKSTTLTIDLTDDSPTADAGESFKLTFTDFSDGSGSFTARISIIDTGDVSFNCPKTISVRENDGKLRLQLRRNSDDMVSPMTVLVSTIADGSADDGDDFVGETDFIVDFESNEQTRYASIDLVDDVVAEDSETFTITIRGTRVLKCSISVTIVDDDVPDPFHCGRGSSQPCLNGGTCNVWTGRCTCPSGFAGTGCARALGEQTGCDGRCGKHGWCQSDNKPAGTETITCVCKGGWAGEYCNHTAYYHQCNANSFGICITPYGIENFKGEIYVLGEKDEFACQLEPALGWPADVLPKGAANDAPIDEDGVPNWCRGYAIKLDYNGGICGDFGPTTEGSIKRYTAEMVVQYSSYVTSLDELVTANCEFDNDNMLLHSQIVEFSPSEEFLKKQTSTIEFSPAAISVTHNNGKAIRGPLQLDNRVKVCVSVKQAADWGCIVVRDIMINNTRSDPDDINEYIYENGCMDRKYGSVFTEPPEWVSGDEEEECFTFRLFLFDEDIGMQSIGMGITVGVFVYPTDSCSRLTCTREGEGEDEDGAPIVKRSTTADKEMLVGYLLELEMPDNTGDIQTTVVTPSEAGSLSSNAKDNSMLYTIIGAILGGCLLIAILTAIACVTCRRRNYVKDVIY